MHTPNLKQLEAFCTVVELGSFTGAADKLSMAQSTISGHVAGLEKELGLSLLARTGRHRVDLTVEGRWVYDQAKAILGSCEGLSMQVAEQASRELAVGGSSIPMQYVLPALIAEFARQEPACHFTLRQGDSQRVHAMVEHGDVHLGFVGSMLEGQELHYDRICSDPLVLVTPDTPAYRQRWEQGGTGNEMLTASPLLFREGGSGTQIAGIRFLRDNGIDPEELNVVARVENSETLLELVRGGLGCAVVSGRAAAATAGLLSFPLTGKSTSRELYMIRPQDRRLPRAAAAFADFVLARNI
ncbi:MAG: LysR family transcriptional regulator [Firmicutes bacterium]|nr:LysR family transcriptional regulator [Bacillota bacterium]